MKDIFLAENLKRFRESKGLTKEELGSRIGVSGMMIGHWETRKNEPRMGKVQLIAEVLGVDVDELLFTEPPVRSTENITDLQRRGINAILAISDDELDLLVALLEKHANK